MREMQLFVPLLKVDATTRQVWGIAALEVPDKYGEIFDYTSSKPYVEAWSEEISTATDGQSLGNVRAMHGKVAAGKLVEMNFNDGAKQIEVCAKIVDDNEWAKIEEGVYTGFSIGGGYVKKWDNGDGLKRYTAKPVEVSIVDNPAMPGANFTMFKAAGMAETRSFATYEPGDGERNIMTIPNEAVVARAQELAKAAGAPGYADFISQARTELEKAAMPAEDDAEKKAAEKKAAEKKAAEEAAEKAADGEEGGTAEKAALPTNVDPRNKVKQGWQAEDGSFHLSKAAALAHNDALAKAAADEAANKVQNTMASAEDLLNRIEKGAVIAKAADEERDPLDKPEDVEDEGADKAAKAKAKAKAKDGEKAKDDKKPAFLGKFSAADDLQKGMWEVSRLATIIEDLNWLCSSCCYEADMEKDNSPLPGMLKEHIAGLGDTLRAMVDEEVSEMVAKGTFTADLLKGAGLGVVGLNRLTGVLGARLEKSATDDTASKVIAEALEKSAKSVDADKMQSLHDHACEMGAKCAGMAKGVGLRADDPMEGSLLQKGMELLSAENGELREQLGKAVGLLGTLATKVETLLSQPVVSPPSRLSVVEKGVDTGGTVPGGGNHIDMSKMDQGTLAAAAIRLQHATGGHRIFPGANQGS